MQQRWFRVAVRSQQVPGPLLDGQIVFHGVNKSGSLCMANALRESYHHHGRGDQFQSLYHNAAMPPEDYRALIDTSTGHGFFVAHYLYGAVDAPKRDRVIVSQLRHPVPRMVSCYQWLHNKHVRRHGSAEGFFTLEQYIRRGRGKAHSQIGQFGAGYGPDKSRLEKLSSAELLQLSKENIERDITLLGIAERFEESLFLLAHLCGLPAVPPWRQDVRNANRPLVRDLPDALTDLIAETYRHDLELYLWASQRFEALVAAANPAGDFTAYKAACADQYKERVA